VLAVRQGASGPVSGRRLQDVLRCPRCGKVQWEGMKGSLACAHCGRRLTVTAKGIVLN
jgi:ribosomal protein L37E